VKKTRVRLIRPKQLSVRESGTLACSNNLLKPYLMATEASLKSEMEGFVEATNTPASRDNLIKAWTHNHRSQLQTIRYKAIHCG
jgi:hypothetical protein